eukprot:20734-Heterococcus_DN1.PRE.3
MTVHQYSVSSDRPDVQLCLNSNRARLHWHYRSKDYYIAVAMTHDVTLIMSTDNLQGVRTAQNAEALPAMHHHHLANICITSARLQTEQ